MSNAKFPPGECYMNAYHAMLERKDESGWVVVHGICTGQGPIAGTRFGHAWLEQTLRIAPGIEVVMAYDPGAGVLVTADYYRQLGEITNTVTYALIDLQELIDGYGHYGPFDETIRAAHHNETEG